MLPAILGAIVSAVVLWVFYLAFVGLGFTFIGVIGTVENLINRIKRFIKRK